MENLELRQQIIKIISANAYTTWEELYSEASDYYEDITEVNKIVQELIDNDVVSEHDDRLRMNY